MTRVIVKTITASENFSGAISGKVGLQYNVSDKFISHGHIHSACAHDKPLSRRRCEFWL